MKCPIKFKHGGVPDSKFNPQQLKWGIKVEQEHTNSKCLAKQIAKAHLLEHKDYYTRLRKAKL